MIIPELTTEDKALKFNHLIYQWLIHRISYHNKIVKFYEVYFAYWTDQRCKINLFWFYKSSMAAENKITTISSIDSIRIISEDPRTKGTAVRKLYGTGAKIYCVKNWLKKLYTYDRDDSWIWPKLPNSSEFW